MKNELGHKVMDFTLEDVASGKEYSLHKLLSKDGVSGAVLVFMSKYYPVSNACDERYIIQGRFDENDLEQKISELLRTRSEK